MKHFLSLLDIDREIFFRILETAKKFKNDPWEVPQVLTKKTFGLLFEKPSTRTRISFEVGVVQLGGYPVVLNSNELQLSRGESLRDSAHVFSRFLDGLLIRTFAHQNLEQLAKYSSIPIINGLSDLYHPCQALADFLTIAEQNLDFEKTHLVFLGDGNNNVTHSLILASGLAKTKITVLCPKEMSPAKKVLGQARSLQTDIQIIHDIKSLEAKLALQEADILYTDVWVSMGQEKEKENKINLLKPYQVNNQILNQCKASVKIMHCLPAHIGEEITEEVLYSNSSIVFDQAENRLHAQKALLAEIYKH
ncbi:MAG: ornithine carbamoyltransferase [Candidatus Hydrogenedentota bacterium]|nr:MAG: ornithine carbamoyltransferase [Candidatus Hydrogenedentota bacterium]